MKKALAIVAVAGLTGLASANDIVATEWTGGLDGVAQNPGTGDYFNVPGIGGAGGFAIAMGGPANDSTFNGATDVVGLGLGNLNTILSDDAQSAPGSLDDFEMALSISSDDGELWPAGFSVGGQPATSGGWFLGANAGGTPVNVPGGALVSFATIEGFDAGGGSLFGPFDITSFGNFTAGAGGTWDGSLGVSISNATGLGVAEVIVTVHYSPAPGALAVLGLGGLAAARRRR